MPLKCFLNKITMGNLKEIQLKAKALRREKAQLDLQISALKANLDNIDAAVQKLKRQGVQQSDDRIAKLLKQQETLVEKRKGASTDWKKNRALLLALGENITRDYDLEKDIEQLDDSYPILLFPLRLETRFKKVSQQNQLWVRVYPDDCNVVKQEPHLTEDELSDARSFWAEMAKAGKIEAEERGAWYVLAKSHGSNRAAWIIEQYKPLNPLPAKADASYKVLVLVDENDQPKALNQEAITYWKAVWQAQADVSKIETARSKLEALLPTEDYHYYTKLWPFNLTDILEAGVDDDKIIISKINLPNPAAITVTQSSWNKPAQAIALPDKFVAITYTNGNKSTHVFEHSVKDDLAVGLDPSLEERTITKSSEGIHLSAELSWMVDFEEAVLAGMATRINLTPQEAQSGFDQVVVFGLRASSDAATSKAEIEELITAHKFSNQGFSFLKQGTPTNTTEGHPSGYSWSEDVDESFDRLFKGTEDFVVSEDSKTQSDAQRFAEALSLNPEILQGLPNANGKDQVESMAMNTALFPATMGYFMEEMMDPLFTERDIEATRKLFAHTISGRGPIPAIKMGKQPYGILPITRFSRLQFRKDKLFENRVIDLLKHIDETWDSKVSEVSYIGKEGNPHQILLDVLGLHANSVDFHQRYAQSIEQLYNQLRLSIKNPVLANTLAAAITGRGRQILGELGLDPETKLPILEKFFLSKPNKLSGPLVDDVPESETEPIRGYTVDGKNYVEWLQAADGNTVRMQNFDGNPAPNALLYLLLRHSVLLAQANAGTNFLLTEKLIETRKIYHDPAFLHIQEKESGKSKFEHLYQPYESITRNSSVNLIEHIYKQEILHTKGETKVLREVLQALKILEKTPTARLERLLIEHLDSCTYRIDSWKTGLTHLQIKQQQQQSVSQQKDPGIYIGAYGWLLDLRPKKDALQEKQLSQQDAEFFAPKGEKIFTDRANLGYIHAPSIDQAATAAILRNAYDSNKDSGDKNPFAINLSSERVRIANDFLEGIRNGQSLAALLGYQFERGLHDSYQAANIEADKFIYPLRMAFPLVSDHLKSAQTTDADVQEANETNNVTDTSIDAIEARNVIDGLKLIQHVQNSSSKTYPFGKSNLQPATNPERDAITEEVNRLIDINDAIVDLLMAEQVYQTVKGNFDRSAAVANAYSKGSYPPEMEVVNTPRSGLTLNHKVAIHFDAEADSAISPNAIVAMTPKATTEPAVNKWLSDMLPMPENVLVKVKVRDPDGREKFVFVSQKNLGLQPIDLLFSALLENEQAMTELDDRIVNFLVHDYLDSSGNPLNQFAEIAILYTEEIDASDKSKVGFFELGTTLNSLRKILVNRPYVNPSSLQLPADPVETEGVSYDVNDLARRIDNLKVGLQTQYAEITTILNGVTSIQSLSEKHEERLQSEGLSEQVMDLLNQNLTDQLKGYLLNHTPSAKTDMISQYEALLDSHAVVNPLKSNLIAEFESYLDEYASDFNNLSAQLEATCSKFMAIALYDNMHTGTGFIHQAIGSIFKEVVENVHGIIERWAFKKTAYDEAMTLYTTAVSDDDKIQVLQQAERSISSQATYPVPDNLPTFKDNIDAKKRAFDAVLDELKDISTYSYSDVNDFITRVNAILGKVSDHDMVPYDAKNNRNDLYEALNALVQLKEDVYRAILSLRNHVEKKLAGYQDVISRFATLNSEQERIDLLLDAARQVLREDVLIVPHLKLSPAYGSAIQSAYDNREAIQEFSKTKEHRLFPVEDWLVGVARVREHIWHFENLIALTNGFNPDTSIDLNPLQFPSRSDARWLAMKFIDDHEDMEAYIKALQGDALLYTAHFARGFDASKPFSGIVIDEWTEVVPLKNETTGIAFHYDQPNSEPPQTMLLVTPSQLNGQWEWDDILGAMEETLAMAKKRAVEPSMIDSTKFGQFLPTTLMAVSSHWITVAMNLSLNNFPLLNEQ